MNGCGFKSFSFFFCGRPIPKARPRAKRVGSFVRIYQEISDFENGLSLYAKMQPGRPRGILCSVNVDLVFKFLRPKSVPNWKIYKSSVPDWDNLAKVAGDALKTAGYFRDDSQIVSGRTTKVWTNDKDDEGVRVSIKRLECRTKTGCN